MNANPLVQLQSFGQSVWLDFISRGMLESGDLERFIREDGLRGVTSNPAIFEKAIAHTSDYDTAIREMVLAGKTAPQIYEALTVQDVGRAADLLRPVYTATSGRDGFVSLEVSPHLADDTQGTIAEARRLWEELDRPNVFIKVPATLAGRPAIQQLTREGININVTLLFGLPRYQSVAEAYVAGLEARATAGQPLGHVASVASFFLSRIDVLLDPQLEERAKAGGPIGEKARGLVGQAAIASAKLAYQMYKEVFGSDQFRKISLRGARTQRLLWASTSTKNPAYPDTKYVEPLIGTDTVNTLPPETLSAYRDHGRPAARLDKDVTEARRVFAQLAEVGIDIDAATDQLEREGVKKFNQPFESLMQVLAEKCNAMRAAAAGPRK